MDKNPTPDSLLKAIGYNSTGNNSMLRRGCRKSGCHYSSLCGQCQMNECAKTTHYFSGKEGEKDGFNFGRTKDARTDKHWFSLKLHCCFSQYIFCSIKLHYGVNKILDFA